MPWKLYIKKHNEKDGNNVAQEPLDFTSWYLDPKHHNNAIYEIQH